MCANKLYAIFISIWFDAIGKHIHFIGKFVRFGRLCLCLSFFFYRRAVLCAVHRGYVHRHWECATIRTEWAYTRQQFSHFVYAPRTMYANHNVPPISLHNFIHSGPVLSAHSPTPTLSACTVVCHSYHSEIFGVCLTYYVDLAACVLCGVICCWCRCFHLVVWQVATLLRSQQLSQPRRQNASRYKENINYRVCC